MRVTFCGVRGSTPSPGEAFVRYGGNTSCVAVTAEGDDVPRLLLDAGTGLARLSLLLGEAPFRGSILLGHLHWDHTHGLPFFPSGDRDDSEVHLFAPGQGDAGSAKDVLARALSPPHFPITPDGLRGTWTFDSLESGRHRIEGFDVLAREIPHKGGRTFGYRVERDGASLAYLSDHGPAVLGGGPDGFGPYHDDALALCEGVDLLIHDAQHTAAEFPAVAHFGHSAIDYALGLAERAAVRHLVLFHHAPRRSDAELDELVAAARAAGRPFEITAAAEGATVHLG